MPVWAWLLAGFFALGIFAVIATAVWGGLSDVTLSLSPSPSPVRSASPSPVSSASPSLATDRPAKLVTGTITEFKREGSEIHATLLMNNQGTRSGKGVCTVTAYDASGKPVASQTFESRGDPMDGGSSRFGTAVISMLNEADAKLVDSLEVEKCHLA